MSERSVAAIMDAPEQPTDTPVMSDAGVPCGVSSPSKTEPARPHSLRHLASLSFETRGEKVHWRASIASPETAHLYQVPKTANRTVPLAALDTGVLGHVHEHAAAFVSAKHVERVRAAIQLVLDERMAEEDAALKEIEAEERLMAKRKAEVLAQMAKRKK